MPVYTPKYWLTRCLQKIGRRGIFQHDSNPKHTAMTWLNRLPDFDPIDKGKGRASQPLQQRPAKNGLHRMAGHAIKCYLKNKRF